MVMEVGMGVVMERVISPELDTILQLMMILSMPVEAIMPILLQVQLVVPP